MMPSEVRPHTEQDRQLMSELLNSYGRFRTMREHMQQNVPAIIVEKCLAAAGGVRLTDIKEILHHRCWRGCDPGTHKGPHHWEWFPAVIANEIRSRREQAAAAQNPFRKTHWSEYGAVQRPELIRGASSFSTLDDFEVPA